MSASLPRFLNEDCERENFDHQHILEYAATVYLVESIQSTISKIKKEPQLKRCVGNPGASTSKGYTCICD